MEKTYLQPNNVPKPAGDYSQGLKVKGGTLVVISGQVAWDAQGNLVGKGDLEAQTRQVFENLKNMLASAGATFSDVVKLGIFLKNREDFAVFKGDTCSVPQASVPANHSSGGEGPGAGRMAAGG